MKLYLMVEIDTTFAGNEGHVISTFITNNELKVVDLVKRGWKSYLLENLSEVTDYTLGITTETKNHL